MARISLQTGRLGRLAGDARYRPALIGCCIASLFLLYYAAGIIARPGEGYLRVQSNIIYNLVPLAALALSIIPIRRSSGRERIGWLCLALVLLTWQVGDWTFTYYDFFRGSEPPFPGLADAAYYPGYLAFIVAIPLLTFPEGRLSDRRWLIDAAVVMIAAGSLTWEYALETSIDAGGGDTFSGAVALGYPLFDLALLSALVAVLYASAGKYPARALLLTVAALFQIVSDGAYSYFLVTAGYDNLGNPIELGWIAAYLLLALCFLLPSEEARASVSVRPSLLGMVLPYTFAGLLLVAFVADALVSGRVELELLVAALAVIGLVVFRQFLTLRDSLALLVRAANYDEMTGLPNRRMLAEESQRAIRDAGPQREGALLLFGLDDLKAINESFGQDAGDDVVRRVVRTLQDGLVEGQVLARVAGDEFAMLARGIDQQQALAMGQRLLGALLERPILAGGGIVRVTASVGVASYPEHGRSSDDILSAAGHAMADAQAAGGNKVRLHDPASERQALNVARLHWKARITEALEKDRFILHCQPIIRLQSATVHEYELLIRMLDEQGDVLPPASFLDVAERFGLIGAIDRWVLLQAIQLLQDEQRRGRSTRFAVNLSGRAFEDAELLELIGRELEARDVAPGRLTLEVTETAAIADLDRAQVFIQNLRDIGCRFALDDFGVGFSSFAHLKHLPVDCLKIDGSFIRQLPNDEIDRHLVRGIVSLARGLGRETVAEFVQDERTVAILKELGVDYGQGYYLGRPAPVEGVLLQPAAHARAA